MSLFGILGGIGSLVGGILGGNSSSKAAAKAGDLQYRATQDAIAEQRRQFDVTRNDYAPYLEVGVNALGQQGNLVGLNGAGVQQTAIDALRNSPLYQSLFRNGQEMLLQNASATGGLRGGNMQAASMDFGADTLAQVIERQLAQLGGISGRGQQAVGEVGQLGQAATGNIMNQINQGAAARAGAALTQGGIQSQMWNNVGSFLGNMGKWF